MWYARGGPSRDRLGRFQEFYPAPVAWAMRSWDWLWNHTGLALLVWMYDVAFLDAPENVDLPHWYSILPSFTLKCHTVYMRQQKRARVNIFEKRAFDRGFLAGRQSVDDELDIMLRATEERHRAWEEAAG